MSEEHAEFKSRAKELIAYAYLHGVDNHGVLGDAELGFMLRLVLKDGVIDDDEARAIHEILHRVDFDSLSSSARERIGKFLELYPADLYSPR